MAKRKTKATVANKANEALSVKPNDLKHLQAAWKNKTLVIFLGAGMSMPYGIPNWRDLVLQLLLNFDGEYDYFFREYRYALADWMTKHFGFELPALSRVVKTFIKERYPGSHGEQFAEEVKKRLYKDVKGKLGGSSALATLARLIKKSKGGPSAIVTMNFDDLLEQELSHSKVSYSTVFHDGCIAAQSLSILHPHGYLPQHKPIECPDIVFSEDEYHALGHTANHWGVAEMLTFLRRYTVLFLGLSMADPTLRRLLDATANVGSPLSDGVVSRNRRYLVKLDYAVPVDEEYQKAAAGIELRANEYRQKSGREEGIKNPNELERAIKYMTQNAKDCDKRLFDDMGVSIIGLKNYIEIPKLLQAIAGE
jgi:hypothetical protein